MSLVADVAEAVRTELDAGVFSQKFKAIRAYRHNETLPQGRELRVSVVPKGIKVAPASRALCAYHLEIFVVVTKKVAGAGTDVIDPLLGLPEEIVEFFRLRRLADCPDAVWLSTEIDPMVSTGHLEQLKQFTSLVTLSYKVVK
jgi:hypothetical protein